MEAVLQEVNAAVGVTGSFIVGSSGKLEARALPEAYASQTLETVGRTLVQTLAGIELARKRKAGDLDLGFREGRLLVKSLSPGCLCILTARRVNVPLVNLTANVAVRKLKELRKEAPASAVLPAVQAAAPTTSVPAAAQGGAQPTATVGGRVFSLIERELARAIGGEAQLVLYYEVAAMGLNKAAFPRAYLGDLIDRLAGEIDDAANRSKFVQAARQAIGAA
jgi:predicted regulator of Ras-like GTPase activity (Roadblock/LC7/MglB family)